MKKIKFVFLGTLLAVISFLVLAPKNVLASVRCETQYGGGEICVRTGELQLDKKVWNRNSNSFVDNMGLSDHVFVAGEEVTFRIKVKNVGDQAFDHVYVKDVLPNYLYLSAGSLEYTIDDLVPGEIDEREIKARVVNANQLPNMSSICPVNLAEARSHGEYDKDTAQLCIQNKVLGSKPPVKHIPQTGPDMLLLALPGVAGVGFYLKSKFK